MTGTVTLKVTKGPLAGEVFSFDEHDTFIFGRASDCHARLSSDDTTASRHHFILEVNPPDARVRDLGSLNGTYVNAVKYGARDEGETPEEAAKRKFPEVDLRDGDEIRVGKTLFTVQVEVAAACCNCGRPIADHERKACAWVADNFLCVSCRDTAVRTDDPPKPPEPLRCGECGKDVAAEVGAHRHGDYVCQTCQSKAEDDPAVLLVKMLRDETLERGGTAGPGIPGYELGKKLGQGGMGAVYLARRLKDREKVAVKVMLSKVAVTDHARDVFKREIEVTRGLRHPNIVELLDHGSGGSGFYFVMELCPGGSVDVLMDERGGTLSLAEAGPIILQALEGLSFAHEEGFVHRDLKPANLLLTDRNGGIAKVSDFGLAKSFEKAGFSGMTATGAIAGTIPFMPREQVINFKFVKPVSDVFSMGASLYLMLTGRYCRDLRRGADPVQVILDGPIVPIRKRDRGVPRRVAKVIDRSLETETKNRYQTAAEFRSALIEVL